MLMTKKLLVVGAGPGQVPAIQKAQELGITVIVVDRDPNAIGMKGADNSYVVDTTDKECILEIANKHQIDGIMTMQSDLPVPSVGYVNDALNLTGISFSTANYCSNKIETRRHLEKKKCAQPNFRVVNTLEDTLFAVAEIGLPCIIKAPDSSGSRGVVKVKLISQIESAFEEAKSYSRIGEILVEEFIDGLELGAQTFSVGGKCEVVLLHNDTMSAPPHMIPIGHSFPFKQENFINIEEVIIDIKKAVDALGITDGPANIDLIFENKSKSVKIIEIGARIGATCLPELIKYYTGIDWVEATILNALGLNPDLSFKQKSPVAALIIEAPTNGIFDGYRILDMEILDKVLEYEVTAIQGEQVSVLTKGTDRIGKVIAYGNTVEEAEKNVFDIRNSLSINIL